MSSQKPSAVLGFLLIIIGGILLMDSLNIWNFNWDSTAAWILLIMGAWFYYIGFSSKEKSGMVFPATILFSYGLLFLACSWNSWNLLNTFWPVFILGPGLGFIVLYFAGRRETGLLIPGFILTGLALIFFVREQYYVEFWPILIIIVGALLIWKGYQNKQKNDVNN